MSLLPVGFGASGDDYEITDSLRLRDSASASLTRTPSTAPTNAKKFTLSVWVKLGIVNNYGYIYNVEPSNYTRLYTYTDGKMYFDLRISNTNYTISPTRVFRDPSAWYHIVWAVDTTQATASDRVSIYINGVKETSFSSANYPAQNGDTLTFSTNQNNIGQYNTNAHHFDGYLTEFHGIDGQALDADDFGEYNANGTWKAKEYTGTHGTNGFYLPMKPTTQADGFNTVLYTGNDTTLSVNGVGFEPDFVWIKCRSHGGSASFEHILTDAVRGANKTLNSDNTNTEAANNATGYLSVFDSDGFTVTGGDATNGIGRTYAAWCWDAGSGSAASNTNGSITSTVKANDATGFSIVSYTGNGTSNSEQTIGHGLSTAPKVVIVKNRTSGTRWQFYSTDLSSSATTAVKNLLLNSTNAESSYTSQIRGIQASNTFSVRDVDANGNAMVNKSGDNYIAYCFSEVAGYSKIGSYTGTGTTTGNVTTTGFRPAFLMVKGTSITSEWVILDNTRDPNPDPAKNVLHPNRTNADSSAAAGLYVKFTDTGFQPVGVGTDTNSSGQTYIYMAFADTRDAKFNFDASGNKNNFDANNINSSGESESTYDLMKDTPSLVDENAANFCTWNPLGTALATYTITLSEANLKASYYVPTNNARINGTLAVSSGKWYFEFQATAGSPMVGFATTDGSAAYVYDGNVAVKRLYAPITGGNTSASYGATWNTTNTIGVALDLDAGTLTFYKDNVSQGVAYTGLSGTFTPTTGYQGGSTVTGLANFGQRPFKYTPPTGFLKLNTFNLPDSTIEDGSDYFNTVLYSGNSSTQSITGVGFQPDFVWAKDRTNVVHHTLNDAVRGVNLDLFSSSTSQESNDHAGLTAFTADGYNLSSSTNHNVTGHTYVGWNWLAGNSTSTSTAGSVNSTVSVNTTAGFSIVGFTSPGSGSFTIGHGLSASPDLIIMKRRASNANWGIFHSAVCTNEDKYFIFNTNALISYTDYWGTALPTSTVFGANVGASAIASEAMIAYCWRAVEGYSSFGSYTGNGSSTDGPFVYTGFRPAWVMTKRTDSTSHWMMYDTSRNTFNEADDNLYANLANAENNDPGLDILSNGFKLRAAGGQVNVSSGTYIYMAFAENPFKNALAR